MKSIAPLAVAMLLAGCQQAPQSAQEAGATVDAAAAEARTEAQAAYDRVN